MNCLNCDLPLKSHSIGDIDFLFCQDGCSGIWIHGLKLKRLLKQPKSTVNQFEEAGNEDREASSESPEYSSCPVCTGMQLKRHKYLSKSAVYIHQCYQCNGMWLKASSLITIHSELRQAQGKEKKFDKYLGNSVKKGRKVDFQQACVTLLFES